MYDFFDLNKDYRNACVSIFSNEFCIHAIFNHFRSSNRCAILPRTNVFFYSNQNANEILERRIHLTMKGRLKIDQRRSCGGNMCLALLKMSIFGCLVKNESWWLIWHFEKIKIYLVQTIKKDLIFTNAMQKNNRFIL